MKLEKQDIQGLLVRGYKRLPFAAFVHLHLVGPADIGRVFLQELLPLLTPADQSPENQAVHAAFSYSGFQVLGFSDAILGTFSREFKEGMTDPHRQFILGDVSYNAPEHWAWGGGQHSNTDLLLLLYAADPNTLKSLFEEQRELWQVAGWKAVHNLRTHPLPEGKEHFGFRDGLSQPMIEGLSKSEHVPADQRLAPGEFILGYPNSYAQYPDSPSVEIAVDAKGILPEHPERVAKKDLGKNGSYLVVRQLSQDVPAFWQYMQEHTLELDTERQQCPIKLAAKMVGRWPDGTPLVHAPEQAASSKDQDENDFGYWEEDFHGLKCPLGAHIRRANPRDWLLTEKTSTDSKEMVAKHRILRRGRSYGAPLSPSMEVQDLMDAAPDGQARGLVFLGFVGDIVRQFEFVQNNWIRFQKFGGGDAERDPLLGPHYEDEEHAADLFRVPAQPVRRTYKDLPAFTRLRGGGYFFFPGLKAWEFISSYVPTSTNTKTIEDAKT